MGAAVSHFDKLGENALLRRWTGLEPITDNDPFWNQLLSFNFKAPVTRVDSKYLDDSVAELLESLKYNSPTTGNFAAFVRVFLRRATELKVSEQCEDKIFLWQTSNGLLILRYCCKYFAENLSEEDFLKLFNKNILHTNGVVEVRVDNEEPFESPAEELLNAIIEIIVDLPLNELTEVTQLQALNCAIAFLAGQLYTEKPLHSSKWLDYLTAGKCAIHACLLTKTLLNNYLRYYGKSDSDTSFDGGGSLVFGIAASMLNVLKWGFEDGAEGAEPNVSSQSLQLLLIMVSQYSAANSPSSANPYRQALFVFNNSQEKLSLTTPTLATATFKFDYSRLYDALSHYAAEEPSLLLLYLLIHQNMGFRNYVLSRVNIDTLVLPILKILYSDTAATTGHHVYLALVCMLILTEDDFFCKIVHETLIKDVDWYTERTFTEISLGGLILLILIRTIQVNLVKVRDRYLHTNCLAAMANMSAHFKQLNPFVSQKLVGLLEMLAKRHARTVDHLRLSVEYDIAQNVGQSNTNMNEDLGALEEGIRMLLEIINSCLSHAIHQNPHLIYTLLYKRELFASFMQHPSFQDVLANIDVVLNHFAVRVKSLDKSATVAEVLESICKGANQWNNELLKKFPDLKFKYIEDENTEEFFVPYAWSIVFKHSGYYWDPTKVRLFNAVNIAARLSDQATSS